MAVMDLKQHIVSYPDSSSKFSTEYA